MTQQTFFCHHKIYRYMTWPFPRMMQQHPIMTLNRIYYSIRNVQSNSNDLLYQKSSNLSNLIIDS